MARPQPPSAGPEDRQPLLPATASFDSLDELQPTGHSSTAGGGNDNADTVPRDTRGGDNDSKSIVNVFKKNSWGDAASCTLQALSILFLVLIWTMVFNKLGVPLLSLPLFGWHPLLQSLGLLLLVQSTSVLQPTSVLRPREKGAAAVAHRWVNAMTAIVFTLGASVMWYLHSPGGHFISWHGIFGTALVIWTWLQTVLGAASVWPVGQRLLGGEAKAKALWKWHRLSGYLLLPAFLLTLFTGATQTSWTQQNFSTTYRVVLTLLLLAIFAAGARGAQLSKLPKLL